MKLEFTRAEIVRIILDHVNDVAPYAKLDVIQDVGKLPDTIVITMKEQNAAQ
jgi:hypothetical protein